MKKKLIASVFSLAMAFILMTSASFAWFTVSTAPEVTNIDVTMTATKNLEIAKATTNLTDAKPEEVTANDSASETNWGGKITSFHGELNFPATVDSNVIKTVKYDGYGRTAGLEAATWDQTLTEGVGYYTAIPVTSGTNMALSVDQKVNVAAVFGMWLRSNVACAGDNAVVATPELPSGADSFWKVQLADANGQALDGNKISLNANEATPVMVIVYAEGDGEGGLKAKDVATGKSISGIKVSFSSNAVASNTNA